MTKFNILKLATTSISALTKDASNDALLVLARGFKERSEALIEPFMTDLSKLHNVDALSRNGASLLPHSSAPGGRVIFSPFKSLFGDYDDSRNLYESARSILKRAKDAGVKRPFIYVIDPTKDIKKEELKNPLIQQKIADDYKYALESIFLGLMAEAYEPLQSREAKGHEWFEAIDIVVPLENYETFNIALKNAIAIDSGRLLAKDLGGADPERMTPFKFVDHLLADLKELIDTNVLRVHVEKERSVLEREYPLLSAVARASYQVERHHPAVVRIDYLSQEQSKVTESLLFSGKGVTYDTGGLDIKFDGVMRGMSRDKCGASSVAGFFKTLAKLKPTNINASCLLGVVRNSCGADGYVSDEIIISRNGTRVLIGNTDAEGRMVMTDLLCKLKEDAVASPDIYKAPKLFTVATLTGHAIRAFGPYGITLDNGSARNLGVSSRIYKGGNQLADAFEISSLRREDFEMVAPGSSCEDVVQANDKASSATSRGHQFPAAFMIIASGLDKTNLAYTHLDIAGSAEEGHGTGLSLPPTTGSPVAALTSTFVL